MNLSRNNQEVSEGTEGRTSLCVGSPTGQPNAFRRCVAALALAMLTSAVVWTADAAPPGYTLIDLGYAESIFLVDGWGSELFSDVVINNKNQVAYKAYQIGGNMHFWELSSGITNFPGVFVGSVDDINDKGLIVGYDLPAIPEIDPEGGATVSVPYVFDSNTGQLTHCDLLFFGSEPNTYGNAKAISELDQVVGHSSTYESFAHAVLWELNGTGKPEPCASIAGVLQPYTNFPWNIVDCMGAGTCSSCYLFGGPHVYAFGNNDDGFIVGKGITVPVTGVDHAYLWRPATGILPEVLEDLGTLGGDNSWAMRINNQNQVVGKSQFAPNNPNYHATLWTAAGGWTDLGTLGGPQSVALNINSVGDRIVGAAQDQNFSGWVYDFRAFLWEAGVMYDLNNHIVEKKKYDSNGNLIDDSAAVWTLVAAKGISKDGYIVGHGLKVGSGWQTFVLVPPAIEPPSITCPSNQIVVANCDGVVAFTEATSSNGAVTCSAASGSTLGPGVHTITCTASNSGGSAQCSFTVTAEAGVGNIVWHQPVADEGPPGPGKSHSDLPGIHRFKVGSTIPIQVHVAGCDLVTDETSQVDSYVKVELVNQANTSEVVTDLTEDYSGVGEPGGLMDHINGHLKYNLKTSLSMGYTEGTVNNGAVIYKLTVTIKRTGTEVYSESMFMESKP